MAMKNLTTSRVLVVDDKPSEAVPILTALGEVGIGCIYVKGDKVEELPNEPIEGIRLVFLDMRLAEDGNRKGTLSKTLNVLKTCVSKSTMPFIIICWTRHPEDVNEFRLEAEKEFPCLKHGVIAQMRKPLRTSPEKWKNLRNKIQNIIKKYEAIGLIWKWESIIHASATGTSETLADVSTRMAEEDAAIDWQEGLFSVCRELIKADIGEINDKKAVSNSIFRMMNELAVDKIHHSILNKPLSCAQNLIPKGDSELKVEDASRLNQMINIDPVIKGNTSIGPGFIYVQSRGTSKCLFKKLQIGVQRIKKYIGVKKLNQSAIPILIELSPACDFNQNQRPVCTFIAGLIVPFDNSVKSEGHREVLGPLTIPGYDGPKKIVVTKRLVYACSLESKDISNRPICRLRSNTLIDLQVKTATHKARPGAIFLEFKEKKKK